MYFIHKSHKSINGSHGRIYCNTLYAIFYNTYNSLSDNRTRSIDRTNHSFMLCKTRYTPIIEFLTKKWHYCY